MYVIRLVGNIVKSKKQVDNSFIYSQENQNNHKEITKEQFDSLVVGSTYDSSIDEFTPPEVVTANKRLIKSIAFRDRFKMDKKIAIKESLNPIIKAMEDEIFTKIMGNQPVNLDSVDLIMGFDELINEGILTQSDVDLIRSDANDNEVY